MILSTSFQEVLIRNISTKWVSIANVLTIQAKLLRKQGQYMRAVGCQQLVGPTIFVDLPLENDLSLLHQLQLDQFGCNHCLLVYVGLQCFHEECFW